MIGLSKQLTVYVTKKNTEYRITKPGEVEFQSFGQPFETPPCVFVDPTRDKLQTTAFKNEDGNLAVVVMNASDEKLDYHLWIAGNAAKMTASLIPFLPL